MNTGDTSRLSGDEYGWPDFVVTLVVAVFGAAVVFAINKIPGFYGQHIGLILTFVALFWLGFGFAKMPARWWGDLIMIGATLASFFLAIQLRFQADWLIALLTTFSVAVILFWGFSEGMKRLNDWERQRLDREINDVVGVLFFSALGFLVLCGSARIPYAGILLASVAAIFLGVGLGWVELPVWGYATVTILSLTGFFFGLKWQLEPSYGSEVGALFGTCVGLVAFLFGFFRGKHRAKRENKRDSEGD